MSDTRREIILLMEHTRTTQKRLSDLLGLATTTVNRWFREDRPDAIEPPFYALNFMRAYIQLPDKARERMGGPIKGGGGEGPA